MYHYGFFQNKIVDINRPQLLLTDIGLLRGYGVFDLLRTYRGKPFLLDEHLERLENSARILNLKISHSKDEISSIITDLLAKNEVEDVTIRLVVTGGSSDDGLHFDPELSNLIVLLGKLPKYPDTLFTDGAKVITYNFQRELASAKTIDYLTAVKLQPLAKKENAQEILYFSNGKILECSSANFFAVIKNKLVTPKENILIGTTRNLIINLADGVVEVEQRSIDLEEIPNFTECFISSTTREIMPIIKIDKTTIGSGKVGDITKRLMKKFRQAVST